jgi:hypothetical protein
MPPSSLVLIPSFKAAAVEEGGRLSTPLEARAEGRILYINIITATSKP